MLFALLILLGGGILLCSFTRITVVQRNQTNSEHLWFVGGHYLTVPRRAKFESQVMSPPDVYTDL